LLEPTHGLAEQGERSTKVEPSAGTIALSLTGMPTVVEVT